MCQVANPTVIRPPAKAMTGVPPHFAAKNSVCPGCLKPMPASPSLLTGPVTTAR
jgi:hypothetical protein